MAFINGLLPGRLTNQFYEKYLDTLDELWVRIGQGIQGEEVNRLKRELQSFRLDKKDKGGQS